MADTTQTIQITRGDRKLFVEYARFCGNRVEAVVVTEDASLAGEYDERRVRLIRRAIANRSR
jgi:hypothetical protein